MQYGCLKEFWPDTDSIKAYLEHVSLYLQVNDTDKRKQVPILLSLIGASNYALLPNLVAPDVPGTLSFARTVEVLSPPFELKHSVIAKHFHFHRCTQATREGIAEFDAALWTLATHYEFSATLEEMLCAQFVCRLPHEAIQCLLLLEVTLTYQKHLIPLEEWKLPTAIPSLSRCLNHLSRNLPVSFHVQQTTNLQRW